MTTKYPEDMSNYKGNISSNEQYTQDSSFMIMRINPVNLLLKFKKDLSGKETFLIQDATSPTGMREVEQQVGRSVANDEGIRHILNIVETVINTHSVQGNLKSDHYWEFVPNFREELTLAIALNCYAWDIDDKDLNMVINNGCRIVEIFLTRLIDNKERESYQKEFQSKEVIQMQQKPPSALSNFTNGFKK